MRGPDQARAGDSMYQILFRIPLPGFENGMAVNGFGLMLLCAFLAGNWLIVRLARREGVDSGMLQDLALWTFLGGIAGGRALYMWENTAEWKDFFGKFLLLNQGGLILYGGYAGGIVGMLLGWWVRHRDKPFNPLRVLDVYAAPAALGVAFGRVGCLMNGCCYGQVVPEDAPTLPMHYPLPAAARFDLTGKGMQTAAGFALDPSRYPQAVVLATEPGAGADALRKGDLIVKAQGRDIPTVGELSGLLLGDWGTDPFRGVARLDLIVMRDGVETPVSIRPVTPGLHPAQLYEVVSMVLLCLAMIAYLPVRSRMGQAAALFFLLYGCHRFLNELLRNDPRPIGLENNVSVFLVLGGALVWGACALIGQRVRAHGDMPGTDPVAVG